MMLGSIRIMYLTNRKKDEDDEEEEQRYITEKDFRIVIKLLEHVGAQQRGELSFGKMGIQKAAWQSCYNALISKNISFDIQH